MNPLITNPLIQIAYASAAKQPFTPDALKTLLEKARARNDVYQITGMLLYHNGSLLQVLEGPEASVEHILASIGRDPRHHKVRIISRRVIDAREFESWSMAFIDTSALLNRTTAYLPYNRVVDRLGSSATHARRLLRFFHEGLYHQHLGELSLTSR